MTTERLLSDMTIVRPPAEAFKLRNDLTGSGYV